MTGKFELIIDNDAFRELELYSENFSDIHLNSTVKCLAKFHKRGDFELDRAIAYVDRNLVMPAAKDYLLRHGSMTQSLKSTFPKCLRVQVAESLTRRFVEEFKLGNY